MLPRDHQAQHERQYYVLVSGTFESHSAYETETDCLHGQLVGSPPLDICKFLVSIHTSPNEPLNSTWSQIGRVVVNHEKIPPAESEQLQLTSKIEIGESTSSVDTQFNSSGGRSPTSETLQGSASPQANQLSPSSVVSQSFRNWPGDPSPVDGQRRRQPPTSRPSSTELPIEVSMRRLSSSNIRKSSDDAPQTNDHPRPDAEHRGHSRTPSPQPSSSELPSPQVSS